MAGQSTLAELEVVYAAEHSASCRVVSETRPVRAGDQALKVTSRAAPPAATAAAAAEAPVAPVDPGTAQARVGRHEHDTRGRVGPPARRRLVRLLPLVGRDRIGARLPAADRTRRPRDPGHRRASRCPSRCARAAGRTSARARSRCGRRRASAATGSTRWPCATSRPRTSSSSRWAGSGSTASSGVGYLDGGIVRLRVRPSLQIGAFGGKGANYEGFGFASEGQKYGAFVRLAPGGRYATGQPRHRARLRARERRGRGEPRVREPREPLRQRQPLVAVPARRAGREPWLAQGRERVEPAAVERLALGQPARRALGQRVRVLRRPPQLPLLPEPPGAGGGLRRPAPPGPARRPERVPARRLRRHGRRRDEPQGRGPAASRAEPRERLLGQRRASATPTCSAPASRSGSTRRASRTATPTAASCPRASGGASARATCSTCRRAARSTGSSWTSRSASPSGCGSWAASSSRATSSSSAISSTTPATISRGRACSWSSGPCSEAAMSVEQLTWGASFVVVAAIVAPYLFAFRRRRHSDRARTGRGGPARHPPADGPVPVHRPDGVHRLRQLRRGVSRGRRARRRRRHRRRRQRPALRRARPLRDRLPGGRDQGRAGRREVARGRAADGRMAGDERARDVRRRRAHRHGAREERRGARAQGRRPDRAAGGPRASAGARARPTTSRSSAPAPPASPRPRSRASAG